jgi:hypothetical protein
MVYGIAVAGTQLENVGYDSRYAAGWVLYGAPG